MKRSFSRRVISASAWFITVALILGVLMRDARADSKFALVSNPKWEAECGSCHLAYPPQFLSAESWRHIMAGLAKHFGVDASIDSATGAEIGAFLERYSGQMKKHRFSESGTLRITETGWFRHTHDELGTAVWKNPAIKAPANCGACHVGASHGDYSERGIRLPR